MCERGWAETKALPHPTKTLKVLIGYFSTGGCKSYKNCPKIKYYVNTNFVLTQIMCVC